MVREEEPQVPEKVPWKRQGKIFTAHYCPLVSAVPAFVALPSKERGKSLHFK